MGAAIAAELTAMNFLRVKFDPDSLITIFPSYKLMLNVAPYVRGA
jgi:hypothetical protein